MFLEATWNQSFVLLASKLWPGAFKDFKPEFRMRVNRKSVFFCGKTCDLLNGHNI